MRYLLSAGAAAVGLLVGCGTNPMIARVLCGFADVLAEESEFSKIQQAFAGDDSIGDKVCEAVIAVIGSGDPDAPQEPIAIEDPFLVTIQLPNGATSNLTVVASTK